MKKVISMMMALALTFALAIPAFASSSSRTFSASGSASLASGGQYTFNMEAFTQTPTINVYVPTATTNDKVVLNPYGIKYTLDGEDFTDQIISTPIYLGSLSNVPVKVGMNVKATVAGNAALGNKSFAEDTKTTTNSVFIWGQVIDASVTGASVDLTQTPSGFANAYDTTEGKTGSMILVGADVTRTGLYTIPAADDATDTANTEWACVKFFGDAVKAPTTPWANTDTVTLAITFTFTPSME